MTGEQARAQLVSELVAAGELAEDWRPAFEQVLRHEFIPDTVWRVSEQADGRLMPLRRAEDPDTWLELAYSDAPVNTQVDDGNPPPEGGWEVTSSTSQPAVVAEMLSAMDLEPGMRVLEIGTGTGWNAALMAHRVGAENVVTVEIDQTLARQARAALERTGFGKVSVVTGDGTRGHPDAAPYDRIVITVGVRDVPYTWVTQTRPGGRIVAPMVNSFHPPGLAVLAVHNGTATGRLGKPYTFMGMRADRVARVSAANIVGEIEARDETDLHPRLWGSPHDAAVAIGQRIGDGVRTQWQADKDTPGLGTMWLLEPVGKSWAAVKVGPEPPYKVWQGGPARLFDEVAGAYQWWLNAGKPSVGDWLVTVGPDGQRIELQPEYVRASA